MPDLEKAIANWRQEMIAGNIKNPAILDELESHLRDDVSQQTRSGLNAREAFEAAVLRMGQAAALQNEFTKVGAFSRLGARASQAALTFAGIPTQYTVMNASSPQLESRWATYVRSAAFLLPAVCFWLLSSVYVMPKFKEIWGNAGVMNAEGLVHLSRANFVLMDMFRGNLFWIIIAVGLTFGLLEWRSSRWPRFRRAVLGTGVFLLNLVIMVSFFIMFIGATLAASVLMNHAR